MGIRGKSARVIAVGVCSATAFSGLAVTVGSAPPAAATSAFSFNRLAGSDRYGTAADLAEAALPAGAPGAVLAAGTPGNFPDALAASYLAGYYSAPILLTDPNSVPAATDQALSAMKVSTIAVIGGTSAVSAAVVNHLTAEGYKVSRVAGATRYDTAAQVAAVPPASHVGSAPGGGPTAVLASGANFPDALVSGPMGYADGFPIELTDPSTLSPQTQKSLQSLGIKNVLIAGGTGAVSAAVESQVQALGITTQRFAGSDRTQTATLLATFEVQKLGFSTTTVDLARGDDPGDSLAGAPYGGVNKTPLLLTEDPTDLGQPDVTYLEAASSTLTSGTIFGGTGAVSQDVQDQATTAASGGGPTVTAAASPTTISGNGTATSAISITVANQAGPVSGDSVTITTGGSPSAACGTVYPTTLTTDSNGQASATYTASTTAGTCTITATESSAGATGTVVVTQSAANQVTVTASPSSVPSNGTATSSISATVDTEGGTAVSGDSVTFTLSGSPAAACGTLTNSTGTTNASGVANTSYKASTTEGFCTITATEANANSSGTTQVTQTAVTPGTPDTVSVTANPSSVPADGKSTSTITATVSKASGPDASDPVSFTENGICGTLSKASSTTDGNGHATATYTSSTSHGQCTITVTEANTGASGPATVTQTVPLNVSVKANPSTVPADGKSTSMLTATVTDPNNSDAAVANDTVTWTLSASPAGSCELASPPPSATNTSGQVTVQYTASKTAGTCTVTATESQSGSSGTTTVTQSAYTVAVTATPSSLPGDGATQSTIAATVTDSNSKPVGGDVVTFTLSGTPTSASCGTLSSPPTATTGSSGSTNGVASITYTASTTPGVCTVTAKESDTGTSNTVNITQTPSSSSQYTVTVKASPSTIQPNGTSSTITVTVTNSSHAPVNGDQVTLSEPPSTPSCGQLSPPSGPTMSPNGQFTSTYTSSSTAGKCQITATESRTNASSSVTITQTQAINTITVAAQPATIGSNGYDTSTITATVKDNTNTPLANDVLTFAMFGANPASPPGACGSISKGAMTATGNSTLTVTTGSNGTASVTYTAGTINGSCQVSATDSTTSTGSVQINEVQPTIVGVAATHGTTTLTVTYNEAVVCASVDPDGSQYSVTVNGTLLTKLNASITMAACSPTGLTSKTVALTLTGGSGNPGAQWATGQVLVVTVSQGSTHMTPVDQGTSSEPAGDANTGTVS